MGSAVVPIAAGGVQPVPDPTGDDIVLMNGWSSAKAGLAALEDTHDSDVGKSVFGFAKSVQTKADPETAVAWKAPFDDLNSKYDKAHAAFVAAIKALESQIGQAIKSDEDAFQRAYKQILAQLTASLKAEEKQETQVENRIKALKDLVEDLGASTQAAASKRARKPA